MASSVALNEAREHLDELLDRAERGEEIVIERAGKVPMQLVPLTKAGSTPEKRIGGQNLLGVTYVAPDWNAPMTEEELHEWGM